METNQIARLRRMRDYGPDSFETSRRISAGISSTLAARGFLPLDTPLLERTDLFVRKSGGAIAGSLYAFADPGGIDVSLRPEFTPSVIRWFIENVNAPGVHSFRYAGPVFRYSDRRGAPYRQFAQCGGELLGVPGADGNTRILVAAAQCLADAGVGEWSVRLGQVDIVRDLLRALGLSGPLQMFILSNLDEAARGREGIDRLTERAAAAGLVSADGRARVNVSVNGDAILALESLGSSLAGPTGRRAPERIMARLASRMRQAAPVSEFRAALDSVAALVEARGAPADALDAIADVMRAGGAPLGAVEGLRSTLDALSRAAGGGVSVEVDLTFVRGLAYYTGIVFEFSAGADGGGAALGGGGRYDDLVRAFGGRDTPACGFALNVDALARVSSVVQAEAAPERGAEFGEATA